MGEQDRAKIIKRPWSRQDAIREKRIRQAVAEIVEKQREAWSREEERRIEKIRYGGKIDEKRFDNVQEAD